MQPDPDTLVVAPRGRPDEPATAKEPTTAARADDPVVLRRWVGRYELIHRVAHGGMATVYLGRAKGKAGFEKIVAVKVIHPHLAAEAEFVGMFLDEARIASRIHHPHVVEILDLGESDGVYFMVMEFVEGENLAALVRALGSERLPVPVILQLLADTLEGLSAAHELRDAQGSPYRLVHRDVSPHNVLINLDGWAKVGDFGVMKATGKASSTKTGELRGKLAYMSPEQARGDGRVDHRTDLFALGVVAWELLTGERLFACATEAATLEKVMACEVPSATIARPELDDHAQLRAGLDALLERALAPDPAQRWADAAAMLAEVKRLARLADALGPTDPRDHLGSLMRRFFLRRVEYARAALRRTGEHELLDGSREGEGLPDLDTVPAAMPQLSLVSGERPTTGSHTATPTATPISVGGTPQWWMLLVLPMLGAGIAVAAMLMLGPRFGYGPRAEPAEPVSPAEQPPVEPEPVTRAPATMVQRHYSAPEKPPGVIRWWFSTTPKGAQVIIDGQPRGVTPAFVNMPIGEEPVEIRLELEGYEPHVLVVPPANDQTFTPSLRPLEQPPAGPAKTASKRARTTKPDEPTGEQPGEAPKQEFIPPPDSLKNTP